MAVAVASTEEVVAEMTVIVVILVIVVIVVIGILMTGRSAERKIELRDSRTAEEVIAIATVTTVEETTVTEVDVEVVGVVMIVDHATTIEIVSARTRTSKIHVLK